MEQGQRTDLVSGDVPDLGPNAGSLGGIQDFDRGFDLGQEEGFGTGLLVGIVVGLTMWALTYFVLGVWP